MKSKAKLTMIFLVFCFSANAQAELICTNTHSYGDLYQCSIQQKKIAEDALNKEYMAAKIRITQAYASHQQLGEQYSTTFVDSQRGWLKYRDGQCKLEAFDAEDGSNAHAVTINLCTTRIDKERTAMLEKMPY